LLSPLLLDNIEGEKGGPFKDLRKKAKIERWLIFTQI